MVMNPKTFLQDLAYQIPRFRLNLVREGGDRNRSFTINTPRDAAIFLRPMATAPEEHFVSVHLNTRNQIIGLHEVSHGTLSASLVHPREVFKAALVANSHSIIVCHNHPSGADVLPSADDLATTRTLHAAGRLLGVNLVDHVIVGPEDVDDWYSFREGFPEIWEKESEILRH